jgi:hypothetical protein
MRNTKLRIPFRVILAFTTCRLLYGTASAQNDQVKGVINERSCATMTVQSHIGRSSHGRTYLRALKARELAERLWAPILRE